MGCYVLRAAYCVLRLLRIAYCVVWKMALNSQPTRGPETGHSEDRQSTWIAEGLQTEARRALSLGSPRVSRPRRGGLGPETFVYRRETFAHRQE